MLQVKTLSVRVDNKQILRRINFELLAGEILALMGPNGSGKSTLAYALMGYPGYQLTSSSVIKLNGESLLGMSPDQRARKGLFLAFQHPVAIPGVTVKEVLLAAMRAQERSVQPQDKEFISLTKLRKRLEEEARRLDVEETLLERDVNQEFSGGEKKKMEILQLCVLQPKVAILDEIDSGLDIDALGIVAQGVKYLVEQKRTGVLLITHYQKIINFLEPDRVLIMNGGQIVEQGGPELVKEIEEHGYRNHRNHDIIAD